MATYCKPENELSLTQPQQSLQMLGQVLLVPRLHHDHSQCSQQSAGYKISILTKAPFSPALLTDEIIGQLLVEINMHIINAMHMHTWIYTCMYTEHVSQK